MSTQDPRIPETFKVRNYVTYMLGEEDPDTDSLYYTQVRAYLLVHVCMCETERERELGYSLLFMQTYACMCMYTYMYMHMYTWPIYAQRRGPRYRQSVLYPGYERICSECMYAYVCMYVYELVDSQL